MNIELAYSKHVARKLTGMLVLSILVNAVKVKDGLGFILLHQTAQKCQHYEHILSSRIV
jgi:hypothetical protein